jgi:hypothetical protein
MSEEKEFELKAKERITLLNVLPVQGDILTLRLITEMRKDLSFSEREHIDLEIKSSGNAITWNSMKDTPKKILYGPIKLKLIQDELKKLNDEKKLTLDHVPLYDLFMDCTKV